MRGDASFHALVRERRHERGWRASLLLLLILTFCFVAVIWAANTEIDDVSRSDGRVVPNSSLVLVQAPENGTITRVLVSEGALVEPGQLLMQMDDTQLVAHLEQERQNHFALEARLVRLTSESDGQPLEFPQTLEENSAAVVLSERELFAARAAELEAELSVLQVQLEQQNGALLEAEAMLATFLETRSLVAQQIATIEPMVAGGLEPRTSLIQLQIQASEWDGQVAQAQLRIDRERSRFDEVEQRLVAAESRFRTDALAELAETIGDLAGLRPLLPALEQRVRDTDIRAPVAGVVNQVFVASSGAIVPTGAELLEIVPIDDFLVVEAFVSPADIAFLFVGQEVNIKISAYDFSRYGALDGQIERIGASPIRHPDTDASVFSVEIATRSSLYDAAEQPLAVVPGMEAEIEFVSERKTVIDYIFQPVVRVRDTAFRD